MLLYISIILSKDILWTSQQWIYSALSLDQSSSQPRSS